MFFYNVLHREKTHVGQLSHDGDVSARMGKHTMVACHQRSKSRFRTYMCGTKTHTVSSSMLVFVVDIQNVGWATFSTEVESVSCGSGSSFGAARTSKNGSGTSGGLRNLHHLRPMHIS